MKIQQLVHATQKPEIYKPGTAVMWTDEYIATQLLETHLNPDIELASRKGTTIALTMDWILGKVPGHPLDILDLGCGPGLYAEKFAAQGHRVTGVDFSANSIRHAAASAKQKNMSISYIQKDYLKLDDENQYDLILMIFTDFGVLSPDQREVLLENIHRALKPGGVFIFDVLNDNFVSEQSGPQGWEVVEKGFWRDSPYMALSQAYYYESEKVLLNQHVIVDADQRLEVYRFWIHTFSHAQIKNLLARWNFHAIECHDNLLPGCDMYKSQDVTFCMATK